MSKDIMKRLDEYIEYANATNKYSDVGFYGEVQEIIEELTLMLDIFNSSIVTGVLPLKGSDCHKKILELMQRNGRKATAGSNNDK